MPLLTLKGLIDISSLDMLSNMDKALAHVNRALRAYNLPIWHARRDIPRWVLPATPPQQVLNRIQGVSNQATAMAHQAVQIQQNLNAIAVDAISTDTKIEYKYGSGSGGYI